MTYLIIIQVARLFTDKKALAISAANKYCSFACHHEQRNKKTTGQIKFLAVTIKQQIKLILWGSLCKTEYNVLVEVLPLQFHLQYFLSSQTTHNNMLLHLLTRSQRTASHMQMFSKIGVLKNFSQVFSREYCKIF